MLKKTLILGGTGYIGRALASSLHNRCIQALSRHSSPPLDLLQAPLAPIDTDELIYAVGSVRSLRDASGLAALENTLKALVKPTRFIYFSSLAALPSKDEGPLSPYGKKKAAEEALLRAHGGAHAVTILRPCAIYGGSGGSFRVLLRFLKRYKAYPILPSRTIALVSLEDLCAAVQLCLDHPETAGKSYTVVENHYTWAEASRHFAQKEGITLTGGKPLPHLGILDGLFHEWGEDSSELRALGWKPRPLT